MDKEAGITGYFVAKGKEKNTMNHEN